MKRTQMSFPEPMLEKLDKIASEKDIPRAELIRHIVYDFLKEHDNNDN